MASQSLLYSGMLAIALVKYDLLTKKDIDIETSVTRLEDAGRLQAELHHAKIFQNV